MPIFNFKNPRLLDIALTHRSLLNESGQNLESNERLEFLGDAVLSVIVSEHLYKQFPKAPEGDLTNLRSLLVKTESLAETAKEVQLNSLIKMSRGEADSGGRENSSLLADTIEAVIGAIYLDRGMEAARDFIKKHLLSKIPGLLSQKSLKDPKSLFQEIAQAKERVSPKYRVLRAIGPDHNKIFTVGVFVNNRQVGAGEGKSKQEAEQDAAKDALDKIRR